MTQRNNNPDFPNQTVSLFCMYLTDPNGNTYSYYSGFVDLPEDINGSFTAYALMNPIQPITFSNNKFLVQYGIPMGLVNPNPTNYQTFMLPFYTDPGAPEPSDALYADVIINALDSNGVTVSSETKQGTVSTIKVIQPDGGEGLELDKFTPVQDAAWNTCYKLVLKSCTQNSQFFIVTWASIQQSNGMCLWPLMYSPNAATLNTGNSEGAAMICNWWNWNDSPAVQRGIPQPDPIPGSISIIGSICAIAGQYTTVNIDSETYPVTTISSSDYTNARGL
ncbi:MAG: hypothetical protein WC760_06640 [Bacteroidia bacterium]|jgi:hypothetical protein